MLARRWWTQRPTSTALGLAALALFFDTGLLIKCAILYFLEHPFAGQRTLQATKSTVNTSIYLDLKRSKLQFIALNVLHGITWRNGKTQPTTPL